MPAPSTCNAEHARYRYASPETSVLEVAAVCHDVSHVHVWAVSSLRPMNVRMCDSKTGSHLKGPVQKLTLPFTSRYQYSRVAHE